MNKKFILALLASPTIFTPLMTVIGIVTPAHAISPIIRLKDGTACVKHPHVSYDRFVCTRVAKVDTRYSTSSKFNAANTSNDKVASLTFSESDSDAAIAAFGCDCPLCQNVLRALRGQAPMVY
jgi:queuine/archaeosine tRNA-ribosyltransferase